MSIIKVHVLIYFTSPRRSERRCHRALIDWTQGNIYCSLYCGRKLSVYIPHTREFITNKIDLRGGGGWRFKRRVQKVNKQTKKFNCRDFWKEPLKSCQVSYTRMGLIGAWIVDDNVGGCWGLGGLYIVECRFGNWISYHVRGESSCRLLYLTWRCNQCYLIADKGSSSPTWFIHTLPPPPLPTSTYPHFNVHIFAYLITLLRLVSPQSTYYPYIYYHSTFIYNLAEQ